MPVLPTDETKEQATKSKAAHGACVSVSCASGLPHLHCPARGACKRNPVNAEIGSRLKLHRVTLCSLYLIDYSQIGISIALNTLSVARAAVWSKCDFFQISIGQDQFEVSLLAVDEHKGQVHSCIHPSIYTLQPHGPMAFASAMRHVPARVYVRAGSSRSPPGGVLDI